MVSTNPSSNSNCGQNDALSSDVYSAQSFNCRSKSDAENCLKKSHCFTSFHGLTATTSRQLFKLLLTDSAVFQPASLPDIAMTDVTTPAEALNVRFSTTVVGLWQRSAAVQFRHSSSSEAVNNYSTDALRKLEVVPRNNDAVAYELKPSLVEQLSVNSLDASSTSLRQFKFRQKPVESNCSVQERQNFSW